jgi:hypothetical protein
LARARTGCGLIPPTPISKSATPKLAAHADFRKHLYAYDVVPEAKAAAAALV